MKKKYFLIMLLLLIIIFVLFGKERVIFSLDKIRTEYIDNNLSVTIVGTSLSKWSHKYDIKDNDLYLIVYSNHILSPSTDYEGVIYRFTIPTNGKQFDNIYSYDLFYNKIRLDDGGMFEFEKI